MVYMMKENPYDMVLQELKSEFDVLMCNYLQKLHTGYHDVYGQKGSHDDFINKIKRDCMSIFSDKLGRIRFDDRTEEEVIKEILEYNYDQEDIKHMKEIEKIDLYSQLHSLNKNCIKRSDPEWFQYGIHEMLQKGKVIPGSVGSKRTQFCKCCGEQIYISNSPGHD
jgi:hypothetical protein